MLTGKEEKPPRLTRSNKGNHESEQLPEYLRSTFTETFQMQDPPKTNKGKKQLPQFAFGTSLESPSFFRTPNTLICRESYDNPFLKPRPKPVSKWDTLRSSTLNNFDFYNISEQKFTNLPSQGFQRIKLINTVTNQVHYVQTPQIKGDDHTFQQAYRTVHTSSLFGRKHELFTDFIERNDNQNVYGHLNDRQRPKGQLRDVKNFSLAKRDRNAHSNNFMSTQKSGGFPKVTQSTSNKDLGELYYQRDQKFLNTLNNSIIVTQIDKKLNGRLNKYNADKKPSDYLENEIGLIEVFEKHLEFEKQYGN